MSALQGMTIKIHNLLAEVESLDRQVKDRATSLDARQTGLNDQAAAQNEREKSLLEREKNCQLTETQIKRLETLDSNAQSLENQRTIFADKERDFKAYEARTRQELADLKAETERGYQEYQKAKKNLQLEVKKQVDDLMSKMAGVK